MPDSDTVAAEGIQAAIGAAESIEREEALHDIVAWMESHYRIEETGQPIVLAPYQKAVLRYVLQRDDAGRLKFKTIIWSEPKKGGKTTISGGVIRWAAETWGRFGEIYCVGNDAKQAKERGFAKCNQSVMLEPGWRQGQTADTGDLPRLWHIGTKEAQYIPSGTRIFAVATDYKGEAGANPMLSVWTEVWGILHKDGERFWAEMAPSPTRPDSIRWVETYAGYEGESELLWTLYDSTVLGGRQITAGELGDLTAFEEAPNADSPVPLYVNEAARTVAFWDEGEQAHRQPWQRGENGADYYANEAATQTPAQYERLHLNRWVSAESSYIAIEWWDALVNPLPLPAPGTPEAKEPLVIALDGAVTGDCFGLVVVSRDPQNPKTNVAVRASRKWTPPQGGSITFRPPPITCQNNHKPETVAVGNLCPQCHVKAEGDGTTPWEVLKWYVENYNIIQVAYDPYQLHDFATSAQREMSVWCRQFPQGQERLVADSDLYKLIVERRIRHDGDADLREHLTNANAKLQPNEDSKMRIVKKSDKRKIDLAVCLSMAAKECLRLNL